MKKVLKWIGIVLGSLVALAGLAGSIPSFASYVAVDGPSVLFSGRNRLRGASLSEPRQETIAVPVLADTTVRSWLPAENFVSEATLEIAHRPTEGVNAPEIALVLLQFDIASALPESAIIEGAALLLYQIGASGPDPLSITVHQVTEPWEPDQVTWNTQPVMETTGLPGAINNGVDEFQIWDITELAAHWLVGTNYGLALLGPSEAGVGPYEHFFESLDAQTQIPHLVIDYRVPAATATPTVPDAPTNTATWTPTTEAPTETPTPTATATTACEPLLVNGDFETGELAPWQQEGEVTLGPGYESDYGVQLGGTDNATGGIWQEVFLPVAEEVQLDF